MKQTFKALVALFQIALVEYFIFGIYKSFVELTNGFNIFEWTEFARSIYLIWLFVAFIGCGMFGAFDEKEKEENNISEI